MGGLLDESTLPKFTGMSKYFNSYTKQGRMNWVLATYGTLIAGYLLFGRKKKDKAIETAAKK